MGCDFNTKLYIYLIQQQAKFQKLEVLIEKEIFFFTEIQFKKFQFLHVHIIFETNIDIIDHLC